METNSRISHTNHNDGDDLWLLKIVLTRFGHHAIILRGTRSFSHLLSTLGWATGLLVCAVQSVSTLLCAVKHGSFSYPSCLTCLQWGCLILLLCEK